MRAPPPPPLLLLLLPAVVVAASPAASPATPATPASPAALLVLRAACAARDPAAFASDGLQRYAAIADQAASLHYPFRILSYDDTCGSEWQSRVARHALTAVGSGASVVLSGWPGAATCEALDAAARVLRQARPAVCAEPRARAAVVLHLAERLHWRRVLVPQAHLKSECATALRYIRRELATAGLAVRSAPLSTEEFARQPQVVIMCASTWARPKETAKALNGWLSSGVERPAVLVLHAEELEPPPSLPAPLMPSPAAIRATVQAFQKSNINLDIGKLPYKSNNILNLTPSSIASFPENANLSIFYPELNKKSFPSSSTDSSVNNVTARFRNKRTRNGLEATQSLTSKVVFRDKNIVNTIKSDIVYDSTRNNSLSYIIRATNQTNFKNKYKREPNFVQFRKRRQQRLASSLTSNIEILVSHVDKALHRRILFLSQKTVTGNQHQPSFLIKSAYDEVLQAIKMITDPYVEPFKVPRPFVLYERRINNKENPWQQIAIFKTVSTSSLDDSEDWITNVELLNSTESFNRWSEELIARVYEEAASSVTVPVLIACLASALAAAGSLALGLRWMAIRRRRRRRRCDAVLSPSEFTFPADERRRVGEGMETMLSCWLQQLHEFGGPELERPDLLKQPPQALPHAPSAPSSTCSINRVAVDRRTRYKGDAVSMKYIAVTVPIELKRKGTDVLLVMQSLRHENLNPFIGCLCEIRPALVFDYCGRGSLEDVLMADEIKLDWTFRLSLLTDLVKGMRYLHASPLRVHGHLSSRNCVVDSRWVLRITDYGLPAFYRAHGLPQPERTSRELLWTAPELLREWRGEGRGVGRGSQSGDVFSFAIIMQEVIVRGEPYCMLSLTPDEILEKVMRPPPLIRPSVSMGAAPPEAVSVMRQCWSEAADLRPDFNRLHDIFRHLHRGRKINIVDSMFEMLEKYSNNLEELIRERTEQLDMEKKKTEQLLNRMLPRSVAERLMLGSRVEPEEFEDVSIYFSDIVGFTALAARSTPVQVVDLLNDLYTTFDAAIEQYSVYKVETIGDAYMVVSGVPVRSKDHAESIATMALHLLHLAGRFRVRHLPSTPLHLRIGLHTGPCCTGVVGLTMPRYCLFGDTVNTASRMESTGAAWRIQVSATTAERLTAAGGYRLRSRGLTQIKGKGAMHTYWLLGKEGFDKPLPTPPPLESEEVLFETDGENDSEGSSQPPTTPLRSSQTMERQRSDPSSSLDKYAWQRSGAMSADSSPPRTPRVTTPGSDHSAPYARYRCLSNAGSTRVLRRQWSLERGDALAVAAVPDALQAADPPAPAAPPAALLPPAPAPRPTAPRYRTRPEPQPPPPATPDDDAPRPRPP